MRTRIHCRPAAAQFFSRQTNLVDVSLGGLRICTDERLHVGAFLWLDLSCSQSPPVTCDVEVVWVDALGKGAPARFDAGLRFVYLAPSALKLLLQVLGPDAEGAGPR